MTPEDDIWKWWGERLGLTAGGFVVVRFLLPILKRNWQNAKAVVKEKWPKFYDKVRTTYYIGFLFSAIMLLLVFGGIGFYHIPVRLVNKGFPSVVNFGFAVRYKVDNVTLIKELERDALAFPRIMKNELDPFDKIWNAKITIYWTPIGNDCFIYTKDFNPKYRSTADVGKLERIYDCKTQEIVIVYGPPDGLPNSVDLFPIRKPADMEGNMLRVVIEAELLEGIKPSIKDPVFMRIDSKDYFLTPYSQLDTFKCKDNRCDKTYETPVIENIGNAPYDFELYFKAVQSSGN